MDGDPGPARVRGRVIDPSFASTGLSGIALLSMTSIALAFGQTAEDGGPGGASLLFAPFTSSTLAAIGALLLLSAFFSASEVAFFSLQPSALRAMRESKGPARRLVAEMLGHPGHLLTTILTGNILANIGVCALLPGVLGQLFEETYALPAPLLFAASAMLSALVAMIVGELTPRLAGERLGAHYAVAAAYPLWAIVWLLNPVCWLLLRLGDTVLKYTRFSNLRAAPFLTDEELKSAVSEGEAQGVIEEEEVQMIHGILDFSDALLREILVPRPDVIAISEDATVRDAIEAYRESEFSRMPIYKDSLDQITGILFVKDLLQSVARKELDTPVRRFARPPRFVPETMTIHDFVRDAQQTRTHLAIVVDEYGGTEGIVTLEDAIEEVVGDIHDEEADPPPLYEELAPGRFRVDGALSLDELSRLIGVEILDEAHETVAGFAMDKLHKVLAEGDQFEYRDVAFAVEKVEGRRAALLRVEAVQMPLHESQ